MSPAKPRPVWACNEWGKAEHDWLNCPECLFEYENLIEMEQQEADEANSATTSS